MLLEEEDLALAGANVTVTIDDVAFFVNEVSCLVDKHIFVSFILSDLLFDLASLVAVENAHHVVNLEGLARIVVQLRNETSMCTELSPVK